MRGLFRNRKGSITIIGLYIFIIMTASTTMMLYFATLQSLISKNQLEKVQARYDNENDLNKLIYYDENLDKYIKDKIFRRYRSGFEPDDDKYIIDFEKDDELKKSIKQAFFKIRNIDDRECIFFDISSKYNNIIYNTVAYGPFINNIFECNKPFLSEESLFDLDKKMFLDFITQMEKENWDYDCKVNTNSRKINIDKNSDLKLISNNSRDNLFSSKRLMINSGLANEKIISFTYESIIVHLKSDGIKDKNLTIGSKEDEGLIKMNGVLYIEGDLIINQDFEFLGLIIINNGDIIINSEKKPIINGMLLYKGDTIDIDSITLVYDQKNIYKSASFLPGFLDIDIDVIKKY
ncbi:hypothetical protein [Tissierella creatinophila]|uniref:Uncharacterized protein n=1 Tax=Tissierella creatinophila DSM 6911 TaxID=1123403 RepID=A0A1U7M9P3_TISCR|nr:hypothetical protein [Tissierella creatinophila]OLS03929.1 hypothetical protein TICRE_00560 [Tissierella creatinophila DSM 6911]